MESVSNCDLSAKPFCCPLCSKRTKYIQNLHRHIKNLHTDYYYRTHINTLRKNQKKKSYVDIIQNENMIMKQKENMIMKQKEQQGQQPSKFQENRKKGVIIKAGQSKNINSDEIFDIRLIPSFKMIIMGPSRSGKTMFVKDLLTNLKNFTVEEPKTIILIYTVWQPAYDKMKYEGLVDTFIQDNSELESQLSNYVNGGQILFIFDDMVNSKNIQYISDLFMIQGRHNNISLIFISQQGFKNNESFKSINNNTNYMVLMKNERNVLDIQNLAKQITPGPNPLLKQIHKEATKDKYSYLFINFTHEASPNTKYLSHLFNKNHIIPIYVST